MVMSSTLKPENWPAAIEPPWIFLNARYTAAVKQRRIAVAASNLGAPALGCAVGAPALAGSFLDFPGEAPGLRLGEMALIHVALAVADLESGARHLHFDLVIGAMFFRRWGIGAKPIFLSHVGIDLRKRHLIILAVLECKTARLAGNGAKRIGQLFSVSDV